MGPNRHQPNEKRIGIRRGEGGEEWRGGPLWSPALCVARDQLTIKGDNDGSSQL